MAIFAPAESLPSPATLYIILFHRLQIIVGKTEEGCVPGNVLFSTTFESNENGAKKSVLPKKKAFKTIWGINPVTASVKNYHPFQ